MNKKLNIWRYMAAAMAVSMILAGCGSSNADTAETAETGMADVQTTEAEAVEAEAEAVEEAEVQGAEVQTTDAGVYAPYQDILNKYSQAARENWDMEKLREENMADVLSYCYKDDSDAIVGYLPVDLNFDGTYELLVGTITGDEYQDTMILDAYTLKDGKAEQLFKGSERDRYYIIYDEAGAIIIANEGSNSAFNSGYHYFIYDGSGLQVVQAIIYSSEVDEEKPWYSASDYDWDISNDEQVDEEYANGIINSYTSMYEAPGYIPVAEGFHTAE